MKLTNYNAVLARVAAFLLFALPGAAFFGYAVFLWLGAGMPMTDDALKELGFAALALLIAVVFSWMAFTTTCSVELGKQDIRVRSLFTVKRYAWPQLFTVALRGVKRRLDVGVGVDVTVHKTLHVAFGFDVDGNTCAHEVLITGHEIAQLRKCLQGHDKLGVLGNT